MIKTISKHLDINRIEFIITWQCGGKCKHCQIGDEINKPSSHKNVLSGYAAAAVKKLSAVFNITSVMTFGGEPLYYPYVTAAIHRAAAECGIETRQIITNGYFTNDAEKSRDAALTLADSGVNNLLLSVDAFHQEFIPIEPVRRFAQDLVDVKLPGVFLYPAWLVDEEYPNSYNTKTKEILDMFSDIPIPARRGTSGNTISLDGHAARFLHEHYEEAEQYLIQARTSCSCAEPISVKSISIIPNGDIEICGVAIGNIYKEDVLDIVARYNPYEHESMRVVVNSGVTGLLAYAKNKGIELDLPQYMNNCNVCSVVTKALRNIT